ncbi:MAG TPA: site-specific integrase, partial [Treponemataceae bacterium]|nr:site-specific integrase [Treponemataceae bacterium]
KHTKVIQDDPSEGFQGVGKNAPPKGTLTTEQVKKILALPWNDERCRVAVELAFYTGMRLGEIISLTAKNLSRDETGKPVIAVFSSWSTVDGLKGTKTGKSRPAPITEKIYNSVVSLLKSNPHKEASTKYIFWNIEDAERPITHKTIEGAFNRKVCAALGIDEAERVKRHISVHSARHWFNSMMRGELPDEVLRKATGHSSVEMTDHYDSTTEKDLKMIRKAQKKVLTFDTEKGGTDEKTKRTGPISGKG